MAKVIVDGKVTYTDDPPNILEDYLNVDGGTMFIGSIAVIAYCLLLLL